MNEIKTYRKIKNIMEECIFDKLDKGMTPIDILHVLCKEFDSDKCDLSYKEKYNKVILHSCRVYKNILLITKFLENKGHVFTLEDKENLMIATFFHDIGKLYKEGKNHPLFSKYMASELFKNENMNLNINRQNKICDMIAWHGNKIYNRDKISFLTKMIRDADLFDEVCGDSLLQLALENIVGKGNPMIKNLNHNVYTFSDMIILDRNDENIKNEILEKINIEENKELYIKLLNEATEKYKRITDWEIRHDEKMKGIKLMDKDTIMINIK